MTKHPEQAPERKPRSTSQLWARRTKIDQIIKELQSEHAEISNKLKAELE